MITSPKLEISTLGKWLLSEEAELVLQNYFIIYLPDFFTAAVTQMPQACSHFLDESLIKIQPLCACFWAKMNLVIKCLVKMSS